MPNPPPARRPRRRWKVLLGLLVVIVGVVAGLPWMIGSGPGRSRVAARLNRGLAPGRLEFRSLGISWFGPTRLGDVLLKDPKGSTVASAPSALLNRTLGQWIFGASGTLTLDLEGTALDVKRSQDGSIDLAQALQTLLAHPDPKRDLAVRIKGGSLRYRDPALAGAVESDALDLDLRIRPSPDPVSWKLRLAKGGDASLEIQGDFDQWLSRGGPPRMPELQLSAVGTRWPFEAKAAGLDASGRLDGSLDVLRRRGQWRLSGDSRILGLQVQGSPLNGDTLTLDRLDAGWDVAEGIDGWAIRRLSITTPLGELKAEGQLSGPSGTGHQKIEGRVDLAAVARQIPHALHLRDGLSVDRGSARLTIEARGEPGQTAFDVEARVSDLAGRDGDRALSLREPATFNARLIQRGEESSLERLAVKTAFLDASAKGKLAEGVDLVGTLDLAGLRKQLGDWADLGGLELAGRAEIAGTYRLKERDGPSARFDSTLKGTFRDLRIEGAGTGPIRRELATMEASSNGPADPSGVPSSWEAIDCSVRSGGALANLEMRRRGGPVAVSGSASSTIGWAGGERAAQVRLGGDLAADHLAINVLTLVIEPAKDQPGVTRFVASARGRWDFSRSELSLESEERRPRAAFALGPDGLRVSGLGRGRETFRAEGGFEGELESLDPVLTGLAGRPPLGLSGRWSALATARGDAEGLHLAGKVALDEAAAAGKPGRPTSLSASAYYSAGSDRLDLSEFTVSTAYGTLDASGRIEDPGGSRRVDLKGIVSPDFGAINALLVSKVEPGAKVQGKPRSFRASGTLGDSPGGRLSGLDAEVGFDLDGADIYGMKFGASPVVLRTKGGKLSVDPISTTINEGHIRLEPEVDLDAPGGPVLRLAKNSAIREARINDEVSRRVLAFVAPVLDQATRARGLVSVDLDHAEFPIGLGRGRQAKVEGAVVFEDVEFAPGPLANDLLTAIGRRDASLKLDRPVTLTIADGRVNQRGMSVPIGELTRIEMAGWVDFDRNLAITATLPVTASMLGNNPLLSDIAAGTLVKLPITGTLDRPVIDREAMAANLREMGKSLLTRGATRGAMELLMRLGRPRDPDAPPPPPRITPQERKALRQEKKAIRRGEIPPNPPAEGPDRP